MYIQTNEKQIPCAADTGGGDWVFRGAGVEELEGAFQLYADDGVLLRGFDTGEWLRAVRGEGSLLLTNTPAPEPVPEPEPGPPAPSAEEVNAQAIAELSILQAAYQAETDRALAELSMLVAGGGDADAI